MSVGKTIAWIEEGPTDPEYPSRPHDDTLLIHFTDGSALRVSGSSYEEVSLNFGELSRDEARVWARAAQGRRERERLARLKREGFAALPEEERVAREAARRAKMGPFERVMEDVLRDTARSFVADMNRSVYGATITSPKRTRARRS